MPTRSTVAKSKGTLAPLTPAQLRTKQDNEARGGLSASEQSLARRMTAAGSTVQTIRYELGGRYTGEQIAKALM